MKNEGFPERSRLGAGGVRPEPSLSGGHRASPDLWLQQGEAADLAGCSVNAIRKWRREGRVGFRTRLAADGVKRVEVRLGDVLARAGAQSAVAPGRSSGESIAPPSARGRVIVSLADLQSMFERLLAPERRVQELEASCRTLASKVSSLHAELNRLTPVLDERQTPQGDADALEHRLRRLEADVQRLSRDFAALTRDREKPRGAARVKERRGDRAHIPDFAHSNAPVSSVVAPSEPVTISHPPPPAPPTVGSPEGRDATEPSPLATPSPKGLEAELRQLYRVLASRPDTVALEERLRWAVVLRRYDTVLIETCSRFGIATKHLPGGKLTARDRVALTRALADVGLDVRKSPANGHRE